MLDFSKMKWKLREHPTENLFLVYPDLEKFYYEVRVMAEESFDLSGKRIEPHEGLTQQQVMSLIVWSYHIGSPLAQEPSMHKRRAMSLEMIGFQLKTMEDLEKNKGLTQYIFGSNEFINRVAVHFCKFEKSFKWAELCRKQDMLDDVFVTLKSEMTGTEKKSANEILKIKLEIEAKAEGLQQRINQLATEIFLNDTNLLDYAASHVILEQRKPLISPERIVAHDQQKQRA